MKQERVIRTAYTVLTKGLFVLFRKKMIRCTANGSTIHIGMTGLSGKTPSGEATRAHLVHSSSQ